MGRMNIKNDDRTSRTEIGRPPSQATMIAYDVCFADGISFVAG